MFDELDHEVNSIQGSQLYHVYLHVAEYFQVNIMMASGRLLICLMYVA